MKKLVVLVAVLCGVVWAQTWNIGYPNVTNVVATLDGEGTLTISGSGAMRNWDFGFITTPWGSNGVRAVIIENGVTSIGSFAFQYAGDLTSITIPSSVTTIGRGAFTHTVNLTSIIIPYSMTTIGDGAFSNAGLTSITIPNSVTSIGDYAFYGTTGLTSITIPNSVTTIGDWAFSFTGLTSITVPSSVTTIGDWAFSYNDSLTSITILGSVMVIGEAAFESTRSLTEIIVSSDNTNFSSVNGVLFNKDQTTLIAYPQGRQGAYIIPDGVTIIGDRAFYSTGLTSITIPNSVTTIDDMAFCNAISLTSITIPSSVTTIGRWSFSGAGLTSITIPSSMMTIGDGAFALTDYLTEIISLAIIPPTIFDMTFYDTHCIYGMNCEYDIQRINIVVYVPSIEAYRSNANWNRFVNIRNICEKGLHAFEDWEITTPATSVFEGRETEKCTRCGILGKETRSIARLPHTINLPDTTFTYDNTPKRFTTIRFVGTPTLTLRENEHFTATYTNNTNAGVGTASVKIAGINNYSFVDTTINFTITRREVRVNWENTELIWNSEEQMPTARTDWGNYPLTLSGHRINVGNYFATARLASPNSNINLLNDTIRFTINQRRIDVEWENTGPFVFNWTSQRPIAKPEIIRRDDRSVIREIPFNVVVQQDVFAGTHTAAAVARIDDWDRPNISLSVTQYQDFVIQPRPLTPRLRSTPGDTIRTSMRLTKELLDSILTIEIDFDGFATNTQTMETDGKSVLDSVRFRIQNDDSQQSLRSQGALALGEHIVTVSGGSQNYTILPERKIVVIIGERFLILEEYPRATSISGVKKSDNRYGIKFVMNPVSEKSEISVILPNNERAVETKIVIYDITGNVVHSGASTGSATGGAIVWDLRNSAGRFVANGTYLVIAEVKDRNGKIHQYSARLGVNR